MQTWKKLDIRVYFNACSIYLVFFFINIHSINRPMCDMTEFPSKAKVTFRGNKQVGIICRPIYYWHNYSQEILYGGRFPSS